MARYTVEACFSVWDDDTGDRLEVQSDADGLGLVELRSIDRSGSEEGNVVMKEDQLALVIECLNRFMKFREEQKNKDK